jgi:hypothetical protein
MQIPHQQHESRYTISGCASPRLTSDGSSRIKESQAWDVHALHTKTQHSPTQDYTQHAI